MKTETTLSIEKALARYDPVEMCGIKINKFRGRHVAFEVPTKCGTTAFGIIDCVEICEYFGKVQNVKSCYWHINKKHGTRDAERDCKRAILLGKSRHDATRFPVCGIARPTRATRKSL